MDDADVLALPKFVVFEGVDGSGKTTLAHALTAYYRQKIPRTLLYANAFPGSTRGTLGEWVYRLHHGKATDAPLPDQIAPAALQLLHVAAHVDAILAHIGPALLSGGNVILDRYWWSTYSYARRSLLVEDARALVCTERHFLAGLPSPLVVYVMRNHTLKEHELTTSVHEELDEYYHELIDAERKAGVSVLEVSNDTTIEHTWVGLLQAFSLPYRKME